MFYEQLLSGVKFISEDFRLKVKDWHYSGLSLTLLVTASVFTDVRHALAAYLQVWTPGTHCTRGWMGSQKRSRRDGEDKFCPPPEIEHQFSGQLRSLVTTLKSTLKKPLILVQTKLGSQVIRMGLRATVWKSLSRGIYCQLPYWDTTYFDMENPIRSKPWLCYLARCSSLVWHFFEMCTVLSYRNRFLVDCTLGHCKYWMIQLNWSIALTYVY
jgi:hypothetical protein